MHPRKPRAPAKPTRKAVHMALEMQRPLDQDAKPLVRKQGKRREWDESVDDVGERDGNDCE